MLIQKWHHLSSNGTSPMVLRLFLFEFKMRKMVPLRENLIKINFDVAIRDSFSLGAAPCRDFVEIFIFAWKKKITLREYFRERG